MSEPSGDLLEEYKEYLERFDDSVGHSAEFGAFVKHNGRLVKKLAYEEFEPLYREYHQVAQAYFDSIERGDTINDIVVKIVRDKAAQLMLASPV